MSATITLNIVDGHGTAMSCGNLCQLIASPKTGHKRQTEVAYSRASRERRVGEEPRRSAQLTSFGLVRCARRSSERSYAAIREMETEKNERSVSNAAIDDETRRESDSDRVTAGSNAAQR